MILQVKEAALYCNIMNPLFDVMLSASWLKQFFTCFLNICLACNWICFKKLLHELTPQQQHYVVYSYTREHHIHVADNIECRYVHWNIEYVLQIILERIFTLDIKVTRSILVQNYIQKMLQILQAILKV